MLNGQAMRRNVERWRAHAGVPVWAVVKADGYGWGAQRIVRLLDDLVEGFFVADADEAGALRDATQRPIALLAATSAEQISELLDRGVRPNVATLDALSAADLWGRSHFQLPRIRVGIVPAAGWSGLLEDAIRPFARAAGESAVEIELWSHLTAPDLWESQRRHFAAALGCFREAGARIVGTDVAGTAVCAAEGPRNDSLVRIGIGLFGACGSGLGLECAVAIDAPVTDILRSDSVESAGYRGPERVNTPWLAVVRCGYSDGLPSRLAGTNGIVSIGMQYAVLARNDPERVGQTLRLLDSSSDLSRFLGNTGINPHEFIVGLRNTEAERT
ncbi:MAG: alanine racemase [Candidatus Eremiobacteraeota bacterium]|nr:alanine racemase [Candidatus Eremiobacteraeota bacterium]